MAEITRSTLQELAAIYMAWDLVKQTHDLKTEDLDVEKLMESFDENYKIIQPALHKATMKKGWTA